LNAAATVPKAGTAPASSVAVAEAAERNEKESERKELMRRLWWDKKAAHEARAAEESRRQGQLALTDVDHRCKQKQTVCKAVSYDLDAMVVRGLLGLAGYRWGAGR